MDQIHREDQAELDGLVAKIVKANILEEEDAKTLTLNSARKLAEKAKTLPAANLNSAFSATNTQDDEWAGYDMNADIEGKKESA